MNCERFEEFLIVFMEDEITLSEKEMVKMHLESCPYCSKKLEEYQEIRRIFNEEPLPQPSPQVLSSLSKVAREEVERDKTPFWRRWFYSPILVPVLSSAVALMIWISYGGNNIDLFSTGEPYPAEVMAKKTPAKRDQSLSGIRERAMKSLESKQGYVLSDEKPSAPAPVFRQKGTVQEEMAMESAPAGEMIVGEDVKEAAKSPAHPDEPFADFEAQSVNEPISEQTVEAEGSLGRVEAKTEEARKDKKETDEVVSSSYRSSDYDDKLDLALKQQKEENCEASIKTNEELLEQSPPPPNSIKEKAYLSLAECYEQKGKWEEAITNYKNLQDVAPEQARFAKEKVEVLKRKINLLKTREVRPGDVEKGKGIR